MLEKRQEKLLNLVIEKYIKTAEPIGSRYLVENEGLEWSEATVRNDLRELEEAGFLTHPHTSAGRVPTTLGYKYYLEQIKLAEAKLSKKDAAIFDEVATDISDFEPKAKNLAKALVHLSTESVIFAFSPDAIYYTGLSNLFQKPDFANLQMAVSLSSIFDRCEEVLPDFYSKVEAEPKFYFGEEHPFGEALTVLSARCGEGQRSLVALLGPQRMNYKHNWALLEKFIELV